MDSIRQYLLSIIAAAVICAIVRALTRKKGASGGIINLITAVFLVLIVVAPLKNWSLAEVKYYIDNCSSNAETITNYGTSAAEEEVATIIKTQTEAYIVDKAESFGAHLQANVTLNQASPHVPKAVTITGNTSPYLKQKISQFITADLGIPEADQIWA